MCSSDLKNSSQINKYRQTSSAHMVGELNPLNSICIPKIITIAEKDTVITIKQNLSMTLYKRSIAFFKKITPMRNIQMRIIFYGVTALLRIPPQPSGTGHRFPDGRDDPSAILPSYRS